MARSGSVAALFLVMLVALGTAPAVQANPHHCHGCDVSECDGPGCCDADFGPDAEVRKRGTIEAVERAECPSGRTGTHLRFRTADGSIIVHVGPASHLEDSGFDLAAGDDVEIVGWQSGPEEDRFLVAREIRAGDRVLTLRCAAGHPEWARSRRGHGHGRHCCGN